MQTALLRAHGDIILARRDIGISYALAVVLDDLEALIAPTASSGGGKGVRREEARVA